jgi:hypothetical protein
MGGKALTEEELLENAGKSVPKKPFELLNLIYKK